MCAADLNVSHNSLGSWGAVAAADGLAKNSTLVTVDLSYNPPMLMVDDLSMQSRSAFARHVEVGAVWQRPLRTG